MFSKQHKNLTRQEIDNYAQMSAEDQSRLEHRVDSDSFDSEALDGFSEMGLTTRQMKRIDRQFSKGVSPFQVILMTSLGMLTLIVSIYYFTQPKVNQNPEAPVKVTVEVTDIDFQKQPEPTKEETKKQNEEKKSLVAFFKNEKKLVPPDKSVEVPEDKKTETPIEISPLPEKEEKKPTVPALNQTSVKEIYLNNFKLVDYRVLRNKPTIKTEMFVLSGVPANLEQAPNSVDNIERTTQDIPYYDYINKTMAKLNRGNYREVIARCETILATYPDDINALFYSGFAYYNLQQWNEAAENFRLATVHRFNNFREEAEWYQALSLKESGKRNDAITLLEKIKAENGFYAKSAQFTLQKLRN